MTLRLPPLYPIIDYSCFVTASDPILAMSRFARDLVHAGATLIQHRDKTENVPRLLSAARELRRATEGRAILVINDRLDICLGAEADGVHLGQDDVSPAGARCVFDAAAAVKPARVTAAGKGPARRLLIGFSTHSPEQVEAADSMPVDYIAIGPVFPTTSKAAADPVVGLEGVRQARAITAKPLVAIGGITRSNCVDVRMAGADSVAVISDLMASPVKAIEDFLRILG